MKASCAVIGLLSLLVLAAPNLWAKLYPPYYAPYGDLRYQQYLQYLQWQDYLEYLRRNDPYYDLHVMHYQLYLQPYQPNLIYPPCCYAVGIPVLSVPIHRRPLLGGGRVPRAVGRR